VIFGITIKRRIERYFFQNFKPVSGLTYLGPFPKKHPVFSLLTRGLRVKSLKDMTLLGRDVYFIEVTLAALTSTCFNVSKKSKKVYLTFRGNFMPLFSKPSIEFQANFITMAIACQWEANFFARVSQWEPVKKTKNHKNR
jgi:hypothetical protein